MLAKRRLTDRAIRALPTAAPGKRKLYWDAVVPGLAVRVTDTGAKSFVLVGRFGGATNPTARALGKVGAVSLGDARQRAQDWLKSVAAGIDPAHAPIEGGTFLAIATDYLNRDASKLRSVDRIRADLVRLVFPTFGTTPIAEIKRSDIVRLLDGIADRSGPVTANRVLAVLRRIFNWHSVRSDDFRSPIVRGMARPETARDRVLSDAELRAVWHATSAKGFGGMVRFLVLTTARRDEAREMRWSEIAEGVWTLPGSRNKTGLDLVRPLSKAAQALIADQPRLGEIVFSRSGGVIGGLGELKAALSYASGVTFRLHDLRRTARTLMSRAGIQSDHAERCLGHVLGGVRGVYDRHEYLEEKRKAFEALASLVEGIVG
jgi:integrase